jgi:hypothetical protein
MAFFKCKSCGADISYPASLKKRLEAQEWECLGCYSVIAKKRYPKGNGHPTVFSPVGSGLGDGIMFSVVKEFYLRENPDEDVKFTAGITSAEAIIERFNPGKIFWSDIASFCPKPPDGEVIKYSVAAEACELARQGIYPTWKDFDPFIDFKNDRFIVFHIRNIKKAEPRNLEPYFFYRLQVMFEKMIQARRLDYVVLVGNDDPLVNDAFDENMFFDMRKKLSLNQIAYVLKHAKLFVGRDSGIAHVAAATGTQGVAWGYTDKRWFAKTPAGNFDCYLKPDSKIERIEADIDRRLP